MNRIKSYIDKLKKLLAKKVSIEDCNALARAEQKRERKMLRNKELMK